MAFGKLGEWTSDAFDAIGDFGQNIIDSVEDIGQGFIDAHKDVLGAHDDLIRGDTAGAGDRAASFEDTGEDIFGDGGWYKAYLNMLATGGSPFSPWGDLAVKGYKGNLTSKDLGTLAATQVPGFNTGYGATADAAARGAAQGAARSAATGENIGKGALQGGLQAGAGQELNTTLKGLDTVNSETPSWMNTLSSIKDSPYFKGAVGMLAGSVPGLGSVAQKAFGNDTYVGLGTGLAGLALSNAAQRDYRRQADSLQSLYTQDSPYARQLRQQLLRQDASRGRRSQAGTREVELQARLADLNSRNAPTLQNLTAARRQAQLGGVESLATALAKYGPRAYQDYTNPLTTKGYSGDESSSNFMGPQTPFVGPEQPQSLADLNWDWYEG